MSKEVKTTTIQNTLIELGLAENEAKLYEILVQNPDASIPLLKQKSPFSRTMIYYVLKSLVNYGLVETAEIGKKTVFNAAPPEKLEDFFIDREKELKRQKDLLGSVIGDLRSTYALSHNKPGVRFFEGPEGIKEALWDSLTSPEPIFTFINRGSLMETLGETNNAYLKERLKKQIVNNTLYVDTPEARAFIAHHTNDQYSQARLLPADTLPFKAGLKIYDNKISFFTLRNKELMAVIIKDPDLYAINRSWFSLVWNMAEKKSAPAQAAIPTTPKNTFRLPDAISQA